MGIREEIEKLEAYCHQVFNYEYKTINKADILAILDKWETVEEGPLLPSHFVGDGHWAQFYVKGCSPGDHIMILRRRDGD